MTTDLMTRAGLVDLGGFNYITRFALADALIRSGDLTPDGRPTHIARRGARRDDVM